MRSPRSPLAAGHRVVATARTPGALDDLVSAYGDRVLPVALDVTDAQAAIDAVEAGVARFGRINVVVNNAGYANLIAVEDISIDDFRAQIETNLMGVVNVTKAAPPYLRRRGAAASSRSPRSADGCRRPGSLRTRPRSGRSVASPTRSARSQAARDQGDRARAGRDADRVGRRLDGRAGSQRPYRQTVGAMAAMFGRGGTASPDGGLFSDTVLGDCVVSDPAKVAGVILQLVEMADPAQRLLLGSDAVGFAGPSSAPEPRPTRPGAS